MRPQQLLRAMAVVGVGAVFLQQAISDLPLKPRQPAGIVVLLLAVLAVGLMLRLLLPVATARLLQHKDVLVPLGLYVFAHGVLGWLYLLPPLAAFLSPSQHVRLAGLAFSVSAGLVLSIVIAVAYGAWQTALILDVVRFGSADPARALGGLGRWFGRVFGLEVLGWGILFAGLAVAIALGPAALPLAMLLIGFGSLVWNLATVALLLVALDGRLRFWEGFRMGVRVSWVNKARWWKLVVAQSLLLGAVTFISVSYSDSRGPGSHSTHSKTNWSVNGFWIGAYESDCRWYSKLMETLDTPTLGVISTCLALTFGVLAVAIKLRIAEDLEPPVEAVAPAPEGSGWAASPHVNRYGEDEDRLTTEEPK